MLWQPLKQQKALSSELLRFFFSNNFNVSLLKNFIVLSFAWSKSIGVSHKLSYTSPTGYSNFDKINTHHNNDTLHYQQQSLPLTIMTLLVSGRKIKLLVDREDKNDIRKIQRLAELDFSHDFIFILEDSKRKGNH